MFLEGRFWIDPAGGVHRVDNRLSHEEWAIAVVGSSLEALLNDAWIRVQAFPGRYLFIDLCEQTVSHRQAEALRTFFFDQEQAICYARTVVDRNGHETKEFQPGQNLAAWEFACTGQLPASRGR